MTKAKAIEQMRKYSRNVIEPEFARKIAKAFGYQLTDLGIRTDKVKNFDRLQYHPDAGELSAVEVYKIAIRICWKLTDKKVYSNMNGTGSYADDMTKQACDIIEAHYAKPKAGEV